MIQFKCIHHVGFSIQKDSSWASVVRGEWMRLEWPTMAVRLGRREREDRLGRGRWARDD